MHADRPFSLTQGGPFYRLMVRTRLRTPTSMARCWWLAAILWLPIGLAGALRLLAGMPPDHALFDLSIHTRILVALPLLLVAERLLDETCLSAMRSFRVGNFSDPVAIDRIVARAERLRDSWAVEAALLALAVLGGQLVFWNVVGAAGLVHGSAVGLDLLPRTWYALVALPVVQFVMFRWLWRWVIWCRMLVQLARLPLSLLATHGDRAGGLSVLSRPVSSFSGFVLALGSILAGAWATKALRGDTTLSALLPGLAAFLLVSAALALGPLLVFSRHLFRARRRGLAQYGDFMREYTLLFHQKWIEAGSDRPSPLGAADIQSLSDLGNSFQVIQQMRAFVFSTRNLFTVWFFGILPMIPLFASAISVKAVLARIVATVLGGIPL